MNKLKNIAIVLCVILLIASTVSSNYYKNKASTLEVILAVQETELVIERDKEKLADNPIYLGATNQGDGSYRFPDAKAMMKMAVLFMA